MSIYHKLLEHKTKLVIIGLGYVGMPLAVAFARKVEVIGFDLNQEKINQYKAGIDPTNEVGNKEISATSVDFTTDQKKILESQFIIIAVPTPINSDKMPDLSPVENASKIVGQNLSPGSIIVYESTVYPGVTEDICVPILEKESGLKCGEDFYIGYSPERINPGDKVHRLENITKIVSGMDEQTLAEISKVYELVIEAGIHRASSIKVAEAAKVVENSQRDINIAFMNELAMVFDRMGLDTQEVLEAMNTKWNALGFKPGLVGGHCIGVDPYYFIYKAERLGYHSQIILNGRRINDGMAEYIVQTIIKKMILADKVVSKSRVAVFGITFKEDTPDIRNSKIIDIIERLKTYGIEILVVDPNASSYEAKKEYGIRLGNVADVHEIDCLVVAVGHSCFKELSLETIDSFFGDYPNNKKVVIDIKSIFKKENIQSSGYSYWNL